MDSARSRIHGFSPARTIGSGCETPLVAVARQNALCWEAGSVPEGLDSMTLFADRRQHVRFEVVGVLRGSLEVQEAPRVMDISPTGALIETATPIVTGTIRPMELIIDGQAVRVTMCARHLARLPHGPYAVGVEFVSLSEQALASVANLIADAQLT
jgi:hypothetical protein